MKNKFPKCLVYGWGFFLLAAAFACSKKLISGYGVPVLKGISRELAQARKKNIRQIRYQLHFQIPLEKSSPVQAVETLSFVLLQNRDALQIDFKEKTSHLESLVVNQRSVSIDHRNEHLVIPARHLRKGSNQVTIRFRAGDLSLNRSDDFLYTLLVPDRARTVFPVFDQPDLKATFQLRLTLPRDWQALANGPLVDSVQAGNRKTLQFAPSDTISTYLFSFAAGKFRRVARPTPARPMAFLHRETDATKLKESLAPIFQIHSDALLFLEKYTGIPYPFQKFDFVAIPDFQYGGMEHVGAIDYKSATLFLDEGATQDQKLSRSSLISHETAHMWFGDLVTMAWFNDVWMKEVFANFMADKITQIAVPNANFDLKFLVDHFPAAYGVDRTAGANPIRQDLDNLQDAGNLYGNIIYHKAPIMMRQLERLMGPEAFQKGLQQYLKSYAHGNATWPDLIRILDNLTPADLEAWNQVWVNQPGRPVIDYELKSKNNRIGELVVRQQAEDGSNRRWPQFFEITLGYPDGNKDLTVQMNEGRTEVKEAAGLPLPDFILFNGSGQGYGVFPVDVANLDRLFSLQNPVARVSAYINLYENVLNGRSLSPRQLLDFYRRALGREPEELNLKLMTGQLADLYWKYLKPAERRELAPALEKELWAAMDLNPLPNAKKLLFKTYQAVALTRAAQDNLYTIWLQEAPPAGVKLAEDDYAALALALAVRDYPAPASILDKQLARTQNADRRARLQFLLPALSPETRVRDGFFASLKQGQNREKEAWVGAALGYLHHPLRAASSEKYLAESLNLLEEIQMTGDIFFPFAWLQGTLGNYQTSTAAATVRNFLAARPDYNPKLKAKILQAADDLFRAEKWVNR